MNNNKQRNRCFTLIELLVVIAIIGILASMLLPALQMAREHSIRLQDPPEAAIIADNFYLQELQADDSGPYGSAWPDCHKRGVNVGFLDGHANFQANDGRLAGQVDDHIDDLRYAWPIFDGIQNITP